MIFKELLPLVKARQGIHWIEIGVWHGYNAEHVLANCDIEKIYLIDPYDILHYCKPFRHLDRRQREGPVKQCYFEKP